MSIHIASLCENVNKANMEENTDYETVTVQWNDGQRGVDSDGSLSCWGSNITDARIADKDGKTHPAIRPPNLDEKLGVISSDKFKCLGPKGQVWTVKDVLKEYSTCVSHHGYTGVDMKLDSLPDHVVVRTQMALVPLSPGQTEEKVCVSHNSYQTLFNNDPRNALVVCTPSGTHFNSDRVGQNKLMALKVNEETGEITEHWHTVTSSGKRVGDASTPGEKRGRNEMEETNERMTSCVGLEGMQGRKDSFCVVSIPLKQKKEKKSDWNFLGDLSEEVTYRSLGVSACEDDAFMAEVGMDAEVHSHMSKAGFSIERDETEPITITILLYTILQASHQDVPSTMSQAAAVNAIRDMEHVYGLCDKTCRLSQLPEMLHDLSKEHTDAIREKIEMNKHLALESASSSAKVVEGVGDGA